jgi:uncharacterized protein YbjT (DUF2867 family)
MKPATTLVTGGTGKTGRRVAERLERGGHAIRVGSRSNAPAFDWEDRATWAGALDGTDAVYISYYPDLAVPGAPEAIGELTEQAVAAGVRRLVLVSGRGEPEAQRSEQVLEQAADGAEWTVVRASWFDQNFNEGYLLDPVLSGEVALPAGDVPEPFVDADDIADVAALALTEDGHSGEVYEVTGPRLLTFAEAVDEIARATGRDLRYTRIGVDELAAGLAEAQVPDDYIGLLRYIFGEVLDGRNAHVTDGVRRALGREPRDFADFVRDAAATGVWDV